MRCLRRLDARPYIPEEQTEEGRESPGTSYYVCAASITKGKSVCQPIQFLQSAMDEFVIDLVGQRMAAFLGRGGRATLKPLVENELGSKGRDPRPEMRRLKVRLDGIATKIDSVERGVVNPSGKRIQIYDMSAAW